VPSLDLDVADRQTGHRAYTNKALSRLVRAGRILAVRKDLIVLPDAKGRVAVDLPALVDVIAPEPYLITGGRALQHHHLTDQHFFSVVVMPARTTGFSYRGETAVFLTTKPARIWGWQEGERPRIANPERAIIDALSHPRYGVSFPQALDALLLSVKRDPVFIERLAESVRRHDSFATARRAGLLVDRLFGADAAIPFRELIGNSRTPVLLRSTGAADGRVGSEWRVVVNVTTESEAVA
jgi:predicted transcriptional regulator of viral defense system